MEDVIRKGQERLRNLIPGGFGSFKGILLIALAAIVIWMLTGFFRVQPNQQAIQLIFGKPYGGPVDSGLHYNLPSPDRHRDRGQRAGPAAHGDRLASPARTAATRGSRATSTENLMLTGDENIVDIEFTVLWQIKDVFQWAFDVRNGEENVRSAAEAAMREVIGKSNLQYAQTEGRTKIEQDTKDLMQKHPRRIRLGRPHRPGPAAARRPAAGRDRRLPRRAGGPRRQGDEPSTRPTPTVTRSLPRAKGEAASIIQRAEGYKATTVARAKGDVQRFDQVYEQYNKAKDITAERLYLETIEEVLRNSTKVMVDKNGTATGVLPYLPLPDLRQATPPPAPPRQAPAPGPTQGQGGTR